MKNHAFDILRLSSEIGSVHRMFLYFPSEHFHLSRFLTMWEMGSAILSDMSPFSVFRTESKLHRNLAERPSLNRLDTHSKPEVVWKHQSAGF